MKIEIEVSDEIISNLLCSAFEGGSNYWIESTRCEVKGDCFTSDRFDRTTVPLLDGGTVIVTLQDEAYKGKGVTYHLNRPAILRGLHGMLHHAPKHFGDALAGNDDATTGDVFLQCALFGEVVYG